MIHPGFCYCCFACLLISSPSNQETVSVATATWLHSDHVRHKENSFTARMPGCIKPDASSGEVSKSALTHLSAWHQSGCLCGRVEPPKANSQRGSMVSAPAWFVSLPIFLSLSSAWELKQEALFLSPLRGETTLRALSLSTEALNSAERCGRARPEWSGPRAPPLYYLSIAGLKDHCFLLSGLFLLPISPNFMLKALKISSRTRLQMLL